LQSYVTGGAPLRSSVLSQHMNNSDLPLRWKERVERLVQERTGGTRSGFGASDFPVGKVVHLTFPDGSSADFRFGVVVEAPEINEVGVFTEHCGYHIFPFVDTVICVKEKSI
jgi:hypothetical protein